MTRRRAHRDAPSRAGRVLPPPAGGARVAILGCALLLVGCGPKPIYRTMPERDLEATLDEATPRPERSGEELPPPVSSPADSAEVSEVRAAQLEQLAQRWIGTPYRRGRQSESGTDCSGLARSVLSEMGVSLPRSTREQRRTGRQVPLAELAPGDLLFFRLGSSRVNHVGVALGPDRFLHASSSRGVVVDRLDRYFARRLVEARRVFDEGEASADARPDATLRPAAPAADS